jgi:hypothetical protein
VSGPHGASGGSFSPATGADIDAGTSNTLAATPLAIADSTLATEAYVDAAVGEGGAVDSVNGQTGVVVLDHADIGVREKLSADRTYYVRADGSDSNTGLVNNAGGAFLTIQKAIDTACSLDISTFNVTIQIGSGTYTGANSLKPFVGAGMIRILGNTVTPSNVVVSTVASCFKTTGTFDGLYQLDGTKLTSSGANCIDVVHQGANVRFSAIEFGAASIQINANAGTVTATGNYSISAGAFNHIGAFNNGLVDTAGYTITITNTPAFSGHFVRARAGAIASVHSSTYSGSATGVRYDGSLNAVINANGAGATYLPGNTGGAVATGAQYS